MSRLGAAQPAPDPPTILFIGVVHREAELLVERRRAHHIPDVDEGDETFHIAGVNAHEGDPRCYVLAPTTATAVLPDNETDHEGSEQKLGQERPALRQADRPAQESEVCCQHD